MLPMFYVTPAFPNFCKKFTTLFAVTIALYFVFKATGVQLADEMLKIVASLVLST